MRKIFLTLLMLFMGSSTMAATLSGTVYGGSDPLEGATVSVTVAGETESVASVVTDASGAYSFTLADNTYNLGVLAPADSGYGSSVVNDVVIAGADAVQDVVLVSGAVTLSGKVTLSDGTPVSNVKIIASPSGTTIDLPSITTDANGDYSYPLPSGNYDWELIIPTYTKENILGAWYHSRTNKDIDVTADRIFDITLDMVKITGKTTDANGVGITGAYIGVSGYYSPNGGVDYFSGVAEQSTNYSVQSDANGSYSFWVPSYTDYTVLLTPPDGSGFAVTNINNVDFSIDRTQNFVFETAVTLSGKVTLSDGTPVSNVKIIASPSGTTIDLPSITTDANGDYSYPLPSGNYDWELIIPTYTKENILGAWYHSRTNKDIDVTADRIFDITLDMVKITGKTTDANGVGITGAYIGVSGYYSPNGGVDYFSGVAEQSTNYSVQSDANGSYSFWVPSYTDYTVLLTPPDGSGFALTNVPEIDFSISKFLNFILPLPDTSAPVIIAEPVITAITDTTATVSWQTDEPSTSLVSYGEAADLSENASVPGYTRDHSVLLTELTAETLHSVQVSSSDETGNGPTISDIVTFSTLATPDTTPPVIVEGPIITEITHNAALVEWTTDEMTTGDVKYGLGSSLDNTINDNNLSTHHSVLLSGLTASTAYSVQVEATDSKDNGPTSSIVVSFTTLDTPDTTAPMIISGPMVIDITTDAATIVWQTDEPATSGVSYHDGVLHGLVRDETLTTEHSMRLTNLDAVTEYFFTVSSEDALGNGPVLSNEKSFTTLGETDTQGPIIIGDIKIVAHQSNKLVTVHWNTDEPSNAVIKYGTDPENLDLQMATSKMKERHNELLTGLMAETSYYLSIESTDALGNTEVSEVVPFTTGKDADTTAPSFTVTPTVLKANDKSVTIGWETNEPTEYQIKYGIGTERNLQKANGAKKTDHQVILNKLQAGQNYGYTVIITDTAGNQTTFDSNQ